MYTQKPYMKNNNKLIDLDLYEKTYNNVSRAMVKTILNS